MAMNGVIFGYSPAIETQNHHPSREVGVPEPRTRLVRRYVSLKSSAVGSSMPWQDDQQIELIQKYPKH